MADQYNPKFCLPPGTAIDGAPRIKAIYLHPIKSLMRGAPSIAVPGGRQNLGLYWSAMLLVVKPSFCVMLIHLLQSLRISQNGPLVIRGAIVLILPLCILLAVGGAPSIAVPGGRQNLGLYWSAMLLVVKPSFCRCLNLRAC
jgi:hypothetical protein